MGSIWAVAKNTIKQAVRMKIAVVFTILLIVLLPVMGTVMSGDGTVKGRLQSFVSYALSLTSMLLCLFTIVVSIYSVTSDFSYKQIYTVLTKPIRRFQFLLGKLLGVVLLDAVLLVLFSAIIYVITIYIPRFSEASEAELSQAQNEFYTARAGLTPAEVDVTEEVLETYKRLEKRHQLPESLSRDEILAKLASDIKAWKRSAGVGRELIWQFDNVKPLDANASLFVRAKYDVSVNPPDLHVYSRWFVGDNRAYPPSGYGFDRRDPIRTFFEIEVPADAVAEDGYLAVGFLNVPLNETVVIFPHEDGLEVLYKADTFTGNFVRAVLLILFRLIFLTCLGLLASSFLSFPVAILLCLVVFFTATVSGFVVESFDSLGENTSGVYSYTVKPIIRLLPQFDKFNPTKFLVPARLLSWFLVGKVGAVMVCLKAFLLAVTGLWIFSRREVAKISV